MARLILPPCLIRLAVDKLRTKRRAIPAKPYTYRFSSLEEEAFVDSLLVGKEDVEILIVNDGSAKDNTAQIADEYEKKYSTVCKAIHKENGGHGDAVMFGLRAATGEFFKVVDSDDYLDEKSFLEVLNKLKEFIRNKENIDMLLCNFVYDKVGVKKKKVMTYKRNLPVNKKFEWEDIKPFHTGQYILMHSVIYRRELLIENGLDLPKHTF